MPSEREEEVVLVKHGDIVCEMLAEGSRVIPRKLEHGLGMISARILYTINTLKV